MEATLRPTSNLPQEEQNRRLRFGVILFSVTLILAVVLLKLGIRPVFRTLLFVPFLVAAQGVYMGLFKTCGIMAAQGMRATEDGAEKIADPEERARVWKLGRTVLLVTIGTAVALTALVALLP